MDFQNLGIKTKYPMNSRPQMLSAPRLEVMDRELRRFSIFWLLQPLGLGFWGQAPGAKRPRTAQILGRLAPPITGFGVLGLGGLGPWGWGLGVSGLV